MATDDESRGAKLVAFVMYFVNETESPYSTISNYVWALRAWMKFQRQQDPAYGLVEWQDFMQGVEVMTFMPAEPRKQVPWEWVIGAAAIVDLTNFREVQAMLLMLMLLFTFARSETPLPSSYSGAGAFDKIKHTQCVDVKLQVHDGVRAVGWRLKAIKQDPRMQRPQAQGEGDWVWVGESDGPLNIVLWLQRFFLLLPAGVRAEKSPFFRKDQGSEQPLLYRTGLDDVRRLWARVAGVGADLAKTCGLHGLRVLGNNSAVSGKGKEYAVVQGGWAGEGTQGRYDRFRLADILDLPRAMIASWSQSGDAHLGFGGIQGVAPSSRQSFTPPAPRAPAAPRTAPVERAVSIVGANRNIRLQSRSTMFPASPAARAPAPVVSPMPARARVPPPRPARASPTVAPFLPPLQRRDTSSTNLSLNRPVRSMRPIDRLQAGVSGDWSSACDR